MVIVSRAFEHLQNDKAIASYQKLRLKLVQFILKEPEFDEVVQLCRFDIFDWLTTPVYKDIKLLPQEIPIYNTVIGVLTEKHECNQDHVRYLLCAMLYFQPWYVGVPTLFTYVRFAMHNENYKRILQSLLYYIFNSLTTYMNVGEADQHILFIEQALDELILLLKLNESDVILTEKIMTAFANSHLTFMPITCSNSSLKNIMIKIRALTSNYYSFSTLQGKLFPLHKIQIGKGKKIRLGILRVAYLYEIGLIADILLKFDSDLFEIYFFALHEGGLEKLDYFDLRKNCFLSLLNGESLVAAVNQIREKQIDILITTSPISTITVREVFRCDVNLPSIMGMRAAPIQMMLIGDILTTGIDAVDFFLIGELINDVNIQQQFTEKLKTYPGLGQHIYLHKLSHVDRGAIRKKLGIQPEQILFVSNAHIFKISPELMKTWITILHDVPNSILLVMPYTASHMLQFAGRMKSMVQMLCNDVGIDSDRVIISDINGSENVIKVLNAGDVYLDCFPYSGPNSASEAISALLPVVTLEKEIFRHKFVAGLLRQLGLQEFIVHSEEEYISIAKRLALSVDFRQSYIEKIASQIGVNSAYDPAYVAEGLQKLLVQTYHEFAQNS